jgi:hypothetical protein
MTLDLQMQEVVTVTVLFCGARLLVFKIRPKKAPTSDPQHITEQQDEWIIGPPVETCQADDYDHRDAARRALAGAGIRDFEFLGTFDEFGEELTNNNCSYVVFIAKTTAAVRLEDGWGWVTEDELWASRYFVFLREYNPFAKFRALDSA